LSRKINIKGPFDAFVKIWNRSFGANDSIGNDWALLAV
jgi:hypothetical protein